MYLYQAIQVTFQSSLYIVLFLNGLIYRSIDLYDIEIEDRKENESVCRWQWKMSKEIDLLTWIRAHRIRFEGQGQLVSLSISVLMLGWWLGKRRMSRGCMYSAIPSPIWHLEIHRCHTHKMAIKKTLNWFWFLFMEQI